MRTVHVYSNGDDWTVVVMDGQRLYCGDESIGHSFDAIMKLMDVKVVRHWGEFVNDDDTRFAEGDAQEPDAFLDAQPPYEIRLP